MRPGPVKWRSWLRQTHVLAPFGARGNIVFATLGTCRSAHAGRGCRGPRKDLACERGAELNVPSEMPSTVSGTAVVCSVTISVARGFRRFPEGPSKIWAGR